jgi:glycosyltransferase involved in cell wall biosynthesis
MNKQIVKQITLKFPHHDNFSGYDNILIEADWVKSFNLLDYQFYSNSNKLLPLRLLNKIAEKIALLKLTNQIVQTTNSNELLHFLYPENTLAYFDGFRNKLKSNIIISSFHQPLSWFELLYKDRKKCLNNLKNTNYAISLSKNQIPIIQNYLNIQNVTYIPHGVFTDIFIPDYNITRNNNLILTIGSWFRDFNVLKKVIIESNNRNLNYNFLIIAEKKHKSIFFGLNNVSFKSGITTQELITLYQKCSLLLLPLVDSIANNALLEAMSCGTPILVSNVGGVNDYTNKDVVEYINSDPIDIISKIQKIIDDNIFQKNISNNVRQWALQYDWNVVRKDLTHYYNIVSNQNA